MIAIEHRYCQRYGQKLHSQEEPYAGHYAPPPDQRPSHQYTDKDNERDSDGTEKIVPGSAAQTNDHKNEQDGYDDRYDDEGENSQQTPSAGQFLIGDRNGKPLFDPLERLRELCPPPLWGGLRGGGNTFASGLGFCRR